MEPTDLTIHVLREIREEIRETNQRLGRLELRQTDTELRLATEIIAVAGAVREVRDELRGQRALGARVDDHELRISALEDAR
jgi:hypothetical protein